MVYLLFFLLSFLFSLFSLFKHNMITTLELSEFISSYFIAMVSLYFFLGSTNLLLFSIIATIVGLVIAFVSLRYKSNINDIFGKINQILFNLILKKE